MKVNDTAHGVTEEDLEESGGNESDKENQAAKKKSRRKFGKKQKQKPNKALKTSKVDKKAEAEEQALFDYPLAHKPSIKLYTTLTMATDLIV